MNYYTRKECADILGVEQQTISNYIDRGFFAGTKTSVGKNSSLRIDKESFDQFAKKYFEEVVPEINGIEQLKRELKQEKEDLGSMKGYIAIQRYYGEMWKDVLDASIAIVGEKKDRRLNDITYTVLTGGDIEQLSERNNRITKERIRQLAWKGVLRIKEMSKLVDEGKSEYKRIIKRNSALSQANRELARKIIFLEREIEKQIEIRELIKAKGELRDSFSKFMRIDVKDCNLSVRARNVLRTMGIVTLYDLFQYKPEDFMKVHCCGKKSLSEFQAIASDYNMHLGDIPAND